MQIDNVIYFGAYASMGVDNSLQLDYFRDNFKVLWFKWPRMIWSLIWLVLMQQLPMHFKGYSFLNFFLVWWIHNYTSEFFLPICLLFVVFLFEHIEINFIFSLTFVVPRHIYGVSRNWNSKCFTFPWLNSFFGPVNLSVFFHLTTNTVFLGF